MKDWYLRPAPPPDEKARRSAQQRQEQLLKPARSLGALEQLAVRLAALQGNQRPGAERVCIAVFAADHGVAEEGVSRFPQSVTLEMLGSFAPGGAAAISVLARQLRAQLRVVNVGCVKRVQLDHVLDAHVAPGTRNFCREAAMEPEWTLQALETGRRVLRDFLPQRPQLYLGGDMGIGNTTSAAALGCAFTGEPPERVAGAGTGLDEAGVARKVRLIEGALERHLPRGQPLPPLEILRRLGGLEIAALSGSYIAAAQERVAVVLDGFISSAAALAAVRLNPGVRPWLIPSHCSAEQGHRLLLAALQAEPLLDLGMRLGEGSGAALLVSLLRSACALHNEMATFREAEVAHGLD